jgi:hypothetical protein
MTWAHPILPGHVMESSCNIEDWPICHDCMMEHCRRTNCLGCEYNGGDYKDCRFLDIKRHCMNPED